MYGQPLLDVFVLRWLRRDLYCVFVGRFIGNQIYLSICGKRLFIALNGPTHYATILELDLDIMYRSVAP